MLSLLRASSWSRATWVRCYSSKSPEDVLRMTPTSTRARAPSMLDLMKQLQESSNTVAVKKHTHQSKKPANDAHKSSHKPLRKQHPPKKQDPFFRFNPETFKYTESTSDRENEFYTDLFKRIYEVNPQFWLLVIEGGAPQRMSLKQLLKGLNENEAVDMMSTQRIDEVAYPLVRKSEKHLVLKTFSDKKAEELTKMYGRTRVKRRESNVKFVKVSWETSKTDLENQKRNEIMTQLQKSPKLVIAIDSKDNLSDLRGLFEMSVDKEAPKLHELEKIRRENTLEFIKATLAEVANIEMAGNITGKVILNVTPKVKTTQETDKRSARDEKRLGRIEKQRLKEAEKETKRLEKLKQMEETIAKLG